MFSCEPVPTRFRRMPDRPRPTEKRDAVSLVAVGAGAGPRGRPSRRIGSSVVLAVGLSVTIVGASMLPFLRLSQLAHELGHATVAVAAGYEVAGIVLEPSGSAATYTELHPDQVDGARDRIAWVLVLTAGTGGAAAFTAGLLVAVKRMRTGRCTLLGVAAATAVVALGCVPSDDVLAAGSGSPAAGEYTVSYALVATAALLVAAIAGGAVSRVATYALAAVASAGLIAELRELWFPSQHPTDAEMAASLTSASVVAWRAAWTAGAVLVVGAALVQLVRSPNGWPLRPAERGAGGAR